MKHWFTVMLLCMGMVLFTTSTSYAVVVTPTPTEATVEGLDLFEGLGDLTMEEFLTLTPKKIKQKTGQKLKLKEIVALKIAQKKIKKQLKGDAAAGSKSQLIALLLVIFVGGLGIHRFYLGYTGIGIAQLLTLGGCGIWSLIDLIRIVTGDLKPADGSNYDPEL